MGLDVPEVMAEPRVDPFQEQRKTRLNFFRRVSQVKHLSQLEKNSETKPDRSRSLEQERILVAKVAPVRLGRYASIDLTQ
jgi:hypothetical protein